MENKSRLKALHIGEKTAQIPIIQGGMGVGISRSSLAGAVAREGGIGIISTAQIGYCLLYTSPSPRDLSTSRMPSSA